MPPPPPQGGDEDKTSELQSKHSYGISQARGVRCVEVSLFFPSVAMFYCQNWK